MKCLKVNVSTLQTESPEVEVLVMDGAVVVQMLSPGISRTFQDYVDSVFKPYVLKKLQAVRRVDIIWDVYRDDSLKKGTRERRGKVARCKVTPSTQIPKNWHALLRNDENKEELFHLLADQMTQIEDSALDDSKEIYSTFQFILFMYLFIFQDYLHQ